MRFMRYLYGSTAVRAPDGGDNSGGQQGGAQGGSQQGAQQPVLTPEQFTQFTEGMKSLNSNLTEFGGGIKELLTLAKERNAAPAQQPQQGEEPDEEEIDSTTLETLPRAQFMDVMLRKFKANLEASLQPINERINNVGNTVETRSLMEEGQKVKAEKADFMEWKDEMTALAKEHPTLGIRRLYNLARADNPEKAAEMDKKYKKKDDGENPPPKSKPRPFSMSPGGGAGTTETRNQRMNPKDAAQAAWEDTVAKMGGSPFE